jgi:uncharacterized protein VirK/YbjX
MKATISGLWLLFSFLRTEVATTKTRLGFWHALVRVLWVAVHLREHLPVLRATGGLRSKAILASYFRIVYRPTLPYLSTNFSRQDQMALLRTHCEFVSKALGDAFFERIVKNPLPMWHHRDGENEFTISMGGPCPHREGGLTLIFSMNGCAIYRVAFTVIDSAILSGAAPVRPASGPSTRAFYVGQVQGFPGQYALIKEATRGCCEVSPPDMLMAALLGVASAFGAQSISAVRFENCLSFKSMQALNSGFSYAEFWETRWGAVLDGEHYRLDLPCAEKPLSQIKSNHRKRTQVKRELKRQISFAAANTLANIESKCAAPAPSRLFDSHPIHLR